MMMTSASKPSAGADISLLNQGANAAVRDENQSQPVSVDWLAHWH